MVPPDFKKQHLRSTQSPGPNSIYSETYFRRIAANGLVREPSSLVFDVESARAHDCQSVSMDWRLAQAVHWHRSLRDAAVLVPVVARSPLTVLFTIRTSHLPNHAGQISFPGGKIERYDASPLAAALREADEEIGLTADLVEPVGFLDSMRTRTGFNIVPIVGLIRPEYRLDIDFSEVQEVFEVPLEFLMDPRNLRQVEIVRDDLRRAVYQVPYASRYIWGITAGILKNLQVRLFEELAVSRAKSGG